MGVYISGMEMPKGYIDVRIYADGRVGSRSIGAFGETIATAIPVPPHGRLGDLDALVRQFPYLDNFDSGNITMTMKGIRNRIYTAPTIIPAEEGET